MRRLLTLALCIPLYGQNVATPRPKTQRQPVNAMSNVELEAQISALEKEVVSLESRASVLEYLVGKKQDRYDSVTLDTSSRAFKRLDTDIGSFLVSLEDVTPYLNGYKLSLSIGNPSGGTVSGIKVKAKWSTQYDWGKYDADSYKAWESKIHEQEVSLTQAMKAGSWNKVELILVPASSQELGYLEISMDAQTVVLAKP